MENHVVANYENYREEDRLTTNNARRIEYLTTVRAMDELIGTGLDILDCAAGTGIYSFYLADKGNRLTAADITPRHVELINEQLRSKPYTMKTAVLDASDMSIFPDESFDVVLNMGPFYHLITPELREKCMSESVRVLRKGGLLLTAYIPRFYLFDLAAFMDAKYLTGSFPERILTTGIMRHDDEDCFWTDTYFSTAAEMESIYRSFGLEIIDHFAQDGITPMMHGIADKWGNEEFREWCDAHYRTCREPSVLGMSNHVMIVGKK